MSSRYDCTDAGQREAGLRHARDALARGELVVLPTDTVHGIAADAFDAEAVGRLLAAKGRGRAMPPPVLVSDARVLDGLAAATTRAPSPCGCPTTSWRASCCAPRVPSP